MTDQLKIWLRILAGYVTQMSSAGHKIPTFRFHP